MFDQKKYTKSYYDKNKDKILEKAKIYYQKNKERILENCKKYYQEKRESRLEYAKEWHKRNPERSRELGRRGTIKYRYGITMDQYDELVINQKGLCAICGIEPRKEGKKLCVDHNHVTGVIRGLLCSDCNVAIGLFKESKASLLSAVTYLQNER